MRKYPPFIERCKRGQLTFITGEDYTVEYTLVCHESREFLKRFHAFEKAGHLRLGRNDIFSAKEPSRCFMELANTAGFVSHCTIFKAEDSNDSTEYLKNFSQIPFLDLNLIYHSHHDNISDRTFQASRLSLEVCWSELSYFLQWIIDCFPNLQHLFLNSELTLEMSPLGSSVLPNLVHFYTSAQQPGSFWPELVTAAPKLRYVHTTPANALKIERAGLPVQVAPYRDILDNTLDKFDFYNKYF